MDDIISQWDSMSDTQQLDLIERCITKAARREGLYACDVAEHIGGTWERLTVNLQPATLDKINATRAAQDKQPITLVSMIYRAARASIAAAMYDERKHSDEISTQNTDEEGARGGCFEPVFASGRDNTETSAALRADIGQFLAGRDETDKRIFELTASGHTEREIAAVVLISHVAVH